MERRYIESRLWTCLTSAFLEQVRSRYHFEEKDKALFEGCGIRSGGLPEMEGSGVSDV